MTAPAYITRRSEQLGAIVKLGLIAGTLDILAAFVSASVRGGDPLGVLRYIASGVFGPAALTDGLSMAAWGALFHFFIATCWVGLYFLAYPKIPFLSRRRITSGILYGMIVWILMNLVVVPLSNVPPRSLTVSRVIEGAAILVVMIGLPTAFLVHKYYTRRTPDRQQPRTN